MLLPQVLSVEHIYTITRTLISTNTPTIHCDILLLQLRSVHETFLHFSTGVYSGVVSDSYSKPLDRLTSPGATLASPLFHSVVYTATQRIESGRTAEENITDRDMEAVIKVEYSTVYIHSGNFLQVKAFAKNVRKCS